VFLVSCCVFLWSCTAGPQPLPDSQPTISGTVTRVIDGDTIEVQLSSGPIRVRLHSIDAPEKDQPWGTEARVALAGRVDGKHVDLQPVTQDHYNRLVAVVFLGSENINAWMVQQGDAWAYRDYLEDPSYCEWEAVARALNRGLWSLSADSPIGPWEWRAAGRGGTAGFTDYSHETAVSCVSVMHRLTESPARP
jgi:micrococcal nuclease